MAFFFVSAASGLLLIESRLPALVLNVAFDFSQVV
jgi:hypothetical protein